MIPTINTADVLHSVQRSGALCSVRYTLAKPSACWMKGERMRQRPMRTLLWIMFMVMAGGMAACSGVPRGTASSFEAPFDSHHSGMAAISEGVDTTAQPSPPMNADAAVAGRPPGVVRLVAANAVSATEEPTATSPLNDDEVLEEYDPWKPFNRRMFAFNR
jgi:hypothetical protein